ncbi:MAG: 23S rRNA (pseudouridine(1915)-N(3))-methyltransferase RlmH [Clostridia bacterium]|nr:23S rRNA (pseudouridine(1915)-N(3))-methyltransferase RlmH [Clostridia bacterium]
MLHINVICIGKVKEAFFRDAISEYTKRLSKYCNFTITELPDKPLPNKLNSSIQNKIVDFESNQIINKTNKTSYNIVLDSHGRQYTSEDFANYINEIQHNYSKVTFIIGGSLGLSSELKGKCNEMISFSKMTFPHQLMRVFLLEQIFRSFKINNNERYHH